VYQVATVSFATNVTAVRLASVVLTLALLPLAILRGQQATASTPVQVFEAVMRYRVFWMGDSTRFAACRTHAALGRPSDFPSALDPRYRGLLDRDVSDCGTDSRPAGGNWSPVMVVDTLLSNPSDAELRVTARRGEHQHQQRYFLRKHPIGGWSVQRVELSAGIQYLFGRNPGDTLPVRRPP
jgi:hypothetical protein